MSDLVQDLKRRLDTEDNEFWTVLGGAVGRNDTEQMAHMLSKLIPSGLLKFKSYVHERLDKANVPTHPKGPHSEQGCRIGDRLDIVLGVYVASQQSKIVFSTTLPVT